MATCENPIIAVSMFVNQDGKHHLKFISKTKLDWSIASLKEKYGPDNVFALPCGRCPACRENHANEWAIRCTLESFYHRFNYFITLTYSNNYLPYACKKDFDMFIDRMQKFDPTLKYFACAEYGESTGRYHFHCILFLDKELELNNPVRIGSFYHFHCDLLNSKWHFGLHDITPFEHTCARYVAKYTNKIGKVFMSRNLGKQYFLDHKDDVIDDNFKLYGNFGFEKFVVDIPKCFVRWYEELGIDISSFKDTKISRQRLFNLFAMCHIGTLHEEEVMKNNVNRQNEKKKGGLRDYVDIT